jgi:hypothetical protein
MMPDIYCHREGAAFPEEEFLRLEKGQCLHKRGKLHYTTGPLLDPPPDPSLPLRIMELAGLSQTDLTKMTDDDILELANYVHDKLTQ